MRPYERLADNEFEDLVGDLIGTEDDRVYERFRRGADLGIDLRHIDGEQIEVIQCKHYRASSFSKLKTAARKEVKRLEKLDPAPGSYRFVTSRELTPDNKEKLAEILSGWISSVESIHGGGDLDALLDAHPEVERRHVKLWLVGGTALAAMLNSEVYARSRALLERIDKVLPLYVQTDAFLRAHGKLSEEKVCVISGPPGIGKTTLAQMLVSDAIKQGYEPIEVSRDIEEAWRVFNVETAQVFYYDDFLGTTTLGELEKNEDQRLVSFIAAVAERGNALFVLTTREYIYQQARALYESFERAGVDGRRFLLAIGGYARLERAKILYNHVFHATNLPDAARRSLAERDAYRRIVDHRFFNPRLIETFTNGYDVELAEEGVDFVDYAVSVLEDPEVLWRRVYENHITDRERVLLRALVTMPLPARLDDLGVAFASLATTHGLTVGEPDFEAALEILDDSLVATNRIGEHAVANFINPSVEDFIRGRLSASEVDLEAAIAAAVYFEQLASLWGIAEARSEPAPFAAAIASAGLAEPFDAETAAWRPAKDEYGNTRFERSPLNIEQRLELIVTLASCAEDGRAAGLQEPTLARLEELRERWRRTVGITRTAIQLAESLDAEGLRFGSDRAQIPEGILEDLKALLIQGATTPEDYRQIIEFRADHAELFSTEENEEICEQFLSGAADDLTYNTDTIRSLEELDEYGIVAEELGVEIDPKLVEGARSDIEEGLAQAEAAYDGYEDERGDARGGYASEVAEMDSLFSRLGE
jgi:hypothetical protein